MQQVRNKSNKWSWIYTGVMATCKQHLMKSFTERYVTSSGRCLSTVADSGGCGDCRSLDICKYSTPTDFRIFKTLMWDIAVSYAKVFRRYRRPPTSGAPWSSVPRGGFKEGRGTRPPVKSLAPCAPPMAPCKVIMTQAYC